MKIVSSRIIADQRIDCFKQSTTIPEGTSMICCCWVRDSGRNIQKPSLWEMQHLIDAVRQNPSMGVARSVIVWFYLGVRTSDVTAEGDILHVVRHKSCSSSSFSGSCGSLVLVVLSFSWFSGSLVLVVLWFSWFSGSRVSLVLVVLWFSCRFSRSQSWPVGTKPWDRFSKNMAAINMCFTASLLVFIGCCCAVILDEPTKSFIQIVLENAEKEGAYISTGPFHAFPRGQYIRTGVGESPMAFLVPDVILWDPPCYKMERWQHGTRPAPHALRPAK